jgi:hypothetical protein
MYHLLHAWYVWVCRGTSHLTSENVLVPWYIKGKATVVYKNMMNVLGGCIQL